MPGVAHHRGGAGGTLKVFSGCIRHVPVWGMMKICMMKIFSEICIKMNDLRLETVKGRDARMSRVGRLSCYRKLRNEAYFV